MFACVSKRTFVKNHMQAHLRIVIKVAPVSHKIKRTRSLLQNVTKNFLYKYLFYGVQYANIFQCFYFTNMLKNSIWKN